MANSNNNEEPSTAPQPNQWYDITLGPSFKDNNRCSPKFCTLRYEFKPASIDNNQPGSLHKSKDNRVAVEFQNNQHGKPKVSFEGVSEDHKDNDAVLFFDGETFRLERLHRVVKRLRHVRVPGESTAAAAPATAASAAAVVESYSPPVSKGAKFQPSNTSIVHPVQVEQIDINAESLAAEPENEMHELHPSSRANPSVTSLDPKDGYSEEHVDIDDVDDDDDSRTAKRENTSEKASHGGGIGIDINLPHQIVMDDEIADVDFSDNEAEKGPNAAEALRAQVNAEGREDHTSSSSSSSESESSRSETESGSASGTGSGSGSGSETSSSDNESSDGDSVISV